MLARALPAFEPRPGQREMALAVARVFEEGGRILVEAGTGTGKTLAYLVPAILGRQRVLSAVRAEVETLCQKFPLYPERLR